jgi:SAM-dependent methyltransferase
MGHRLSRNEAPGETRGRVGRFAAGEEGEPHFIRDLLQFLVERTTMRLVDAEFKAVNSRARQLLHRFIEFPLFKLLGLKGQDQDILEVGCGSGYGAVLLSRLHPRSYVGIDLMPEMIALPKNRPGLTNAEFLVLDAADMSVFPDGSKDVVVILDILHHIPEWRQVVKECHRVLRVGGRLFLEEPSATAIRLWDAIFHWDHPRDALFGRRELEDHLREVGFAIRRRFPVLPFRMYCLEKR